MILSKRKFLAWSYIPCTPMLPLNKYPWFLNCPYIKAELLYHKLQILTQLDRFNLILYHSYLFESNNYPKFYSPFNRNCIGSWHHYQSIWNVGLHKLRNGYILLVNTYQNPSQGTPSLLLPDLQRAIQLSQKVFLSWWPMSHLCRWCLRLIWYIVDLHSPLCLRRYKALCCKVGKGFSLWILYRIEPVSRSS